MLRKGERELEGLSGVEVKCKKGEKGRVEGKEYRCRHVASGKEERKWREIGKEKERRVRRR